MILIFCNPTNNNTNAVVSNTLTTVFAFVQSVTDEIVFIVTFITSFWFIIGIKYKQAKTARGEGRLMTHHLSRLCPHQEVKTRGEYLMFYFSACWAILTFKTHKFCEDACSHTLTSCSQFIPRHRADIHCYKISLDITSKYLSSFRLQPLWHWSYLNQCTVKVRLKQTRSICMCVCEFIIFIVQSPRVSSRCNSCPTGLANTET